jgi:two-component system, LytTR family, sensor histidine kinase AgrC
MILNAFTEFSVLYLALLYLLNQRLDTSKILLGICVILIPALIGYYYFSQVIGAIIFIIALMSVFYSFSKEKRALVDVCIFILIGIFSDNIVQFLINLMFTESNESTLIHPILFIFVFSFFIILYKTRLKQKVDFFYSSLINHFLIVFFIMIMVVIFYIDVFILDTQELVIANLIIQLTYLSLISIFVILLNRTTKKEYKVQQREMLQRQFSDYVKELESVNLEIQKFRHDYLNILLSLRSYIDEKNFEGLESYFYDYIFPTKQQTLCSKKAFGVLKRIKVMEVKSIIVSKLIQAERVKIKVNLEIPEEILNISLEPIDLTRVLGIYLDNALEASLEVDNPEINIAFFKINECIVIIIENRCNVRDVHFNDILTNLASTKGKKRGLGLKNARTILSQYRNVIFNTRVNDSWFIQEIQITEGN